MSNPPYISPLEFDNTTSRSVRNFEPKIALVPPSDAALSGIDQGDVFYPRLLAIAEEVGAKLVLLEVADLTQARRVATMAYKQRVWDGIEIWRDDPDGRDKNMQDDPATGDLYSVGEELERHDTPRVCDRSWELGIMGGMGGMGGMGPMGNQSACGKLGPVVNDLKSPSATLMDSPLGPLLGVSHDLRWQPISD
ncbi:hypothetical protein LTR66_007466 [Elasticomyces elasticus]|nr:hypothetical protein LTR66_007466 [Elasticomyces elasticus]